MQNKEIRIFKNRILDLIATISLEAHVICKVQLEFHKIINLIFVSI